MSDPECHKLEGKCEDNRQHSELGLSLISLLWYRKEAKVPNSEIELRRFSQVNDHQHLLLPQINLKAHRAPYGTLAQGGEIGMNLLMLQE